jgi:hypothetical protein
MSDTDTDTDTDSGSSWSSSEDTGSTESTAPPALDAGDSLGIYAPVAPTMAAVPDNHPGHWQRLVWNIDSRFRDENPSSDSANFTVTLRNPFMNVVRVRLASIELPNAWYNVYSNTARTNNAMTVNGTTAVTITPGAYASQASLATALTSAFSSASLSSLTASWDATAQRFTISTSGSSFSFSFGSSDLRTVLGFSDVAHTGALSYTAESAPDFPWDPYVYLAVQDFKTTLAEVDGPHDLAAFAKIVNTVAKGSLLFDDPSNLLTKEVAFRAPRALRKLSFRLADRFDNTLVMNGANWSCSLELTVAQSSHAAEAYRQAGLLQN